MNYQESVINLVAIIIKFLNKTPEIYINVNIVLRSHISSGIYIRNSKRIKIHTFLILLLFSDIRKDCQ